MAIKILSIDGGGIRGLIPALLLTEIELRTGKSIAEMFDLLAGTSTGGIIAIGLNVDDPLTGRPYAAFRIARLYAENGPRIFQKKHWIPAIGSLVEEAFQHQGLEDVLMEYFGEATLQDSKTALLVTAYDIQFRKPFYFISREAQLNPTTENFLMRDIARATSAAPTYFEPHLVRREYDTPLALIDGGVFANNPAMLAYSEAINIKRWKDYQSGLSTSASGTRSTAAPATERDFSAGLPDYLAPEQAPDFFMLSLGTGQVRRPYAYAEARDWGLVEWARPVVDILMQGVSESVDYQMQYLLPPTRDGQRHYYRLNPEIPEAHCEMSDISEKNMQALEKIARTFIVENSGVIDEICHALNP